MKVLVTGGAGFIGSNLVHSMLQADDSFEIVVLDDLSTGSLENLQGADVPFVEGSVADKSAVDRAARGVDAIVHLGALGSVPRSIADPITSNLANLNGTLNVLEAARENDAYVTFSSSSSVYGANTKLPKSEKDWTRPMSPYAASKLGAEAYVIAYQHAYSLRTLAFRFFNVYGPRQSAGHVYAAVVPKFLEAAMKGEPLQVHGDGTQSRDFTNVRSVCQVLTDAVTRQVVSESPVNLAFGTNTTLLELIGELEGALGVSLPVEFTDPRPGDVARSQADGVLIGELFPAARPVPLAEGVAEAVAWYQKFLRL